MVTLQELDKKQRKMSKGGDNGTLASPMDDNGKLLDSVTAIHWAKHYPSPLVTLEMLNNKKQPQAREHFRKLKNMQTSLGYSATMFYNSAERELSMSVKNKQRVEFTISLNKL